MALIEIGSQYLEIILLENIVNGHFETRQLMMKAVENNDYRQKIISYFALGLFFITSVYFCLWIYYANKSARTLGAQGLSNSPGWAIGWFFVPIVNLWKSYQAMSELWRASKQPQNWQDTNTDWIIPIWWGFWLVNGSLAQVSIRRALAAETIDEMTIAGMLSMASAAVYIPSLIIAIKLITLITSHQLAQRELVPSKTETQFSESGAVVHVGPAAT